MKKIKTFTLLMAGALCLAACGKWDAVSEGYINGYSYSSPIEKNYAQMGSFATTMLTEEADEPILKQYTVYYPNVLEQGDAQWPLVLIANGTGVPASTYKPIFEHMASWGFIAVGCEDEWMGNGLSVCIMLDHMLAENENPQSVFYHKIDTSQVGLCGHSQGGMAVYSAATQYANRTHYKALCMQSASAVMPIETFGPSAVKDIAAPALMMAGTGNADANSLCKHEDMIATYDSIGGVAVMMGRLVGMDHGDVLKRGDAYTTAWMRYWLCGDTEAARCFVGDNAEMLHNSQWQDVKHKNL